MARWSEQRERDLIQWKQQIESDTKKWEIEKKKDESTWERSRDDEQLHWLREQKIKSYLEVLDHFLGAGELSSKVSFSEEGAVGREEVNAITRELRQGYRWMNSLRAVCGSGQVERIVELNRDLYFTIQALDNVGMVGPGHMVPRREGGRWILSETIDNWSEKLSEILRADLDF